MAACALIAATVSVASIRDAGICSPVTVSGCRCHGIVPKRAAIIPSRLGQVKTAGGDILSVVFVAREGAGEASCVRVVGPFVEVFHGSINISEDGKA